ncbi:MAG: hypothetical protein P8M17_00870 [Saprospiraceae bacterium]|jgi:hypothetical protein|nr:hypothetical protein [bacterium]MDG1432719.1 hypothetical protein [Saprospiraceae bacterium]MDG2417511.1 hypothetical protein [Saprospiraceae bacterium]
MEEPQRRTRKSLKRIFKKGNVPTEAGFANLIDSTINIIDDGINKSMKNGYEFAPKGDSNSLLSFFKSLENHDDPMWQFSIKGKKNEEGLAFEMPDHTDRPSILFFDQDGNIGVNTLSPIMPLTVNGYIGINGRIGTFASGEVDGDNKYHNIIENIKGPSTFEIVARIDGPKGRGKYAMTHAIAICTFPNAFFNKIRQTNTFIGWPWNRIKLRWKTIDGILNLQMKTRTHYGVDANNAYFKIKYHVTNLWNDKHMNGLLDK